MKGPAAIAALAILLSSCGEKTELPPAEATPPAAREVDMAAPSFSGANAYTHCAALCAMGPRTSGSTAYEQQLQYLGKHLKAAGWMVSRQRFKLTDGSPMANLHARFGEDVGNRPRILISCHIDTKRMPDFIGADDGASAAAVMLELARMLAQTPDRAAQVELVFYDGEEAFSGRMSRTNGLYGSRYDAIVRQGLGTMPQYQINLDMVGGKNKIIAPPALDCAPELMELYNEVVTEMDLPAERWTLYPGTYLDDHTPYADAGVPVLNLIALFSNSDWWHTRKDNMSRISSKSLEETGQVTLRLIQHLLTR